MDDHVFNNIISITRETENPGVYDVDLNKVGSFSLYDSIECHIILYPYCNSVNSRNITFLPFEEYITDILSNHRSAYKKMHEKLSRFFGLFLGLIIVLVFFYVKPQDLISVESVVSIFGAYIIGKELWGDVEESLINLTRNFRMRFTDRYYFYSLIKSTTLTHYSKLAKRNRYGKDIILPEYIDFIKQSNSQTVRLFFSTQDIIKSQADSVRILSIQVDRNLASDFEKSGFMLGIKISFNKNRFLYSKKEEIFQSIDKGIPGCLDSHGHWHTNHVFLRKTYSLGRLKYFHSDSILENKSLFTQTG